MLYSAYRPTPLGRILLAGDGDRLTGLWFEGQKYFAASAGEPMTEKSERAMEATQPFGQPSNLNLNL